MCFTICGCDSTSISSTTTSSTVSTKPAITPVEKPETFQKSCENITGGVATADGGVYIVSGKSVWYCYHGKARRVTEAADGESVGPKVSKLPTDGALWAKAENERIKRVDAENKISDLENEQESQELYDEDRYPSR